MKKANPFAAKKAPPFGSKAPAKGNPFAAKKAPPFAAKSAKGMACGGSTKKK